MLTKLLAFCTKWPQVPSFLLGMLFVTVFGAGVSWMGAVAVGVLMGLLHLGGRQDA